MNNENIIQLGDPRLRIQSKSVDKHRFGSAELLELAEHLISLMKKDKGVGLAAPQIGLNERIFVLGFEKNERRPNEQPIPTTVVINPKIIPLSNEKEFGYETCLSIGNGLTAKIPRFTKIAYQGFDPHGNIIEREVSGLHARIVQHEYDHLEGIVFLDRVQDTKTYGFYLELKEAGLI